MTQKKICIFSDHHLSINPRLWKEAFFYEKEGFEVVIITMWQSKDLLQKDLDILNGHNIKYKCYLNIISGEISEFKRFFYRLRKRFANELQKHLKFGSKWAISYAPELLYKNALIENADLYIAHLECGFIVGKKLLLDGKKVGFDFEDWYSCDYVTSERAVRLLSKLEAFALENGTFCTAASQSMAIALKETYPTSNSKEIIVIYNSFPGNNELKKPVNNLDNNHCRLIWTSRTVGGGRGLETLIDALNYLKTPIELNLIGMCDDRYKAFLNSKLSPETNHRLVFYDFISHNELMKMIPDFDIGLAIEDNKPENKNKTVSNKILQYLQSGIRVLATNTEGQKEIADHFPLSVFLVPPDQPQEWKNVLEHMVEQKIPMYDRENQRNVFEKYFSWDAQEKKLKNLISEVI